MEGGGREKRSEGHRAAHFPSPTDPRLHGKVDTDKNGSLSRGEIGRLLGILRCPGDSLEDSSLDQNTPPRASLPSRPGLTCSAQDDRLVPPYGSHGTASI